MATLEDFLQIDMRVGKIVNASDFPEAKQSAYKLEIDFGESIGRKQSSAQIKGNYTKEELQDRLVIAVVNFPPKQIGPFISEVLVLGVTDVNGSTTLLEPDAKNVQLGERVH